jgi:perosamine synthetase
LARSKAGKVSHGESVSLFERAFAQRVGAKWAVAMSNGTLTLQAALVALGVKRGDKVATVPLTMAATSISILNVGATPVFVDVDPKTWLMDPIEAAHIGYQIPVSLYGLNYPFACHDTWGRALTIDDAAQTLRKHDSRFAFTSYSTQRSKIISTGEGGVLVTDDESLAVGAREYASLGYRMRVDQSRIDSAAIKSPDYARHYSLGINGRMNDVTAELGLRELDSAEDLLEERDAAAGHYHFAMEQCEWIIPQHHPIGYRHDFWCYAVALKDKSLWRPLTDAIVRNGGEMPYGAWALTFDEPAFRHLKPAGGTPIASDLQPRLVQFQTNDLASAERNATAVRKAIGEIDAAATHIRDSRIEDTRPLPDATGIPCE